MKKKKKKDITLRMEHNASSREASVQTRLKEKMLYSPLKNLIFIIVSVLNSSCYNLLGIIVEKR